MINMTTTFNRVWAMPNRDTFSIKPISQLLDRWLKPGWTIVDPFARNSSRGNVTNDLNPETSAQHHMRCEEFAAMLVEKGIEADAILFDPPYSHNQCREVYQSVGIHEFSQKDSQEVNRWTGTRSHLASILRPGGIAINFGWNSNGFGKKHGFSIREVLIVPHGGGHNDTIVTVEQKSCLPVPSEN